MACAAGSSRVDLLVNPLAISRTVDAVLSLADEIESVIDATDYPPEDVQTLTRLPSWRLTPLSERFPVGELLGPWVGLPIFDCQRSRTARGAVGV